MARIEGVGALLAAVLTVDSQLPRDHAPGPVQRGVTHVAVGVLIRPDGRFLLTTRPDGKAYEGHWEFPGGKLEPGESVADALTRELQEELGIVILQSAPWREQVVDYPHALVHLHFLKVHRWSGELLMREGQRFSWQELPVSVSPILAGTVPVLEWLAIE